VPAQEEPKFDIAFFNKLYKTDFKSEDDIKSVLEQSSKASELEDKLKEYEALKEDIEFYKNGINPLDYFVSEDAFRIQQFQKQNPDKDASIAYKLFGADLSKMSDFDLIVQYELMNGGIEGGEPTAIEFVESKYGIEDVNNPAEWTALTRTKLKRSADEIRKEMSKLKEDIKLPETINLAEKREAEKKKQAEEQETIKAGWESTMPKLLDNLKEIDIKDVTKEGKEEPLLKYVLEDDVKANMGNAIKDYLVSNRIPVTDEAIQNVGTEILKSYVFDNLPKLLKAYATPLLSVLDENKDKETHNATVLKTEKKPEDLSEDEKTKKELTQGLIGDKGFKFHKLTD